MRYSQQMPKPKPRKGFESSKLSARDEAALAPLSLKQRAVAVDGQPDKSDIDNLNRLISEYNKAHPGRLDRMKKDIDVQHAMKERVPKPLKMGDDGYHAMWMPGDLQEVIEKYWPTIWTNKQHLAWFLDHYPVFKA